MTLCALGAAVVKPCWRTWDERRPPSVLAAALLFMVLWLAAPALSAAGNGCADGGRPRPDEGGIGGTGIQSLRPDDEGGIGGTGISAGTETGVIGTVTGFASICVGGVEIRYGATTPVLIDGQPAGSGQLAVGQVVEVVATGTGSALQARQIAVRHVVSGPVTRVDVQHNQIDVIGQTVLLSPVTRSGDAVQASAAAATAFPLDSYVQVSGMRRDDGVVVASRASPIAARDRAQLVGPVTKLDAGMVWVAGTAVRAASPVSVSIGDEVSVVGHWDGGAIAEGSITSIPRLPFDGHVARVDIEGFAHPATAGRLQVGAFSVEVPAAAAQDVRQLSGLDTRLRIHAVIQDRHVIVEHIRIMDELPALPPLSPRDVGAWSTGRPGDARSGSGAALTDQAQFGEGGGPAPHDGGEIRPDGGGAFGAPRNDGWNDRPAALDRPAMPHAPDRPAAPQPPDRPGIPDRPPIPDRPSIPQSPDRPPLLQIPDRPPRLDRPALPVRPEVPRRP